MQIKGIETIFYGNSFEDLPIKDNRYLYITKWEDCGKVEEYADVVKAEQIFRDLDMEDCYPGLFSREAYLLKGYNKRPERVQLLGTWHDPKDPLKMEIISSRGKVLDVAWGNDH